MKAILYNIKKLPKIIIFYRLLFNTIGRLFPNYFGKFVYEMWFTTVRFKTPNYELEKIETANEETLTVNQLAINIYIWQHKTITPNYTLLFIHGWTGRGSQVANYVIPLINMGYRVISFDGPAHGKTPGKQTSVLEITDVILAIEKQYGQIDSVLTHSFGGMAACYAISLGFSVKNLVLVCPPNNFELLLKNFQRTFALPKSVMKVMIRKSFATHGQVTREAINTHNNIKKLSCNGLIVHDEDDDEIPINSSVQLADSWKNGRLITTQGLGHRRILREPAVVEQIINFFKAHSSQTSSQKTVD